MKRKILIFASVILVLTLLLSFGLIGVYAFSSLGVDYGLDEELFASSGKSSVTTYYAFNQGGEAVKIYESGPRLTEHASLEEIPKMLIDGFISAEDRDFYSHRGVDIKRTAYALVNHLLPRKSRFGASTITQQVIKNISGDDEPTIRRKAYEIMRARHLEKLHTKDEILEMYLNILPMGDNIYGVKMAADVYFGKELIELNLSECAALVGITNAPSKYSPYRNPGECQAKRDRVLYAMLDNGVISESEYNEARAVPLKVKPKDVKLYKYSSWFIETVREDVCSDLMKKYQISRAAARVMLGGGVKIYTTVDMGVQRILEEYFENEDNLPSEVKDGLKIAFTVVNPKDNTLLGIIGDKGRKQGDYLYNNATVPHTPGSVLKPIALYLPLLENRKINWATVIDDIPVEVKDSEDGHRLYPHNSPDVYDGLISVKDAICRSKNTVAVKLYNMLGAESIYKNLYENYYFDTLVRQEKANGVTVSDLAPSPLALGQLTRGVSLRKMTESYTVFYDGGLREPRSYYTVTLDDGRELLRKEESVRKVASRESARIMTALLSEVVNDGTARSLRLKDVVDTAGKTGTSGADRDKWFIGFTPYFTAGIWCGFGDGGGFSPGSNTHLKMWDEVMISLHSELISDIDSPEGFSYDGLLRLPYCKASGCNFTEACSHDARPNMLEYGYFTEDNKPVRDCSLHKLVLDEEGRITAKIDYKRDLPDGVTVRDEYMLIKEGDREYSPEDMPKGEVEQKRKKRFFFF